MQSSTPILFNEETFYKELERDLDGARALVLILCPFLTDHRVGKLRSTLQACINRGVCVCIFVRPNTARNRDEPVRDTSERAIQMLASIGVHISYREHIHQKTVVIDDNILWHGSLNVLSHKDSSDSMMRFTERTLIRQVLKFQRLDGCDRCRAINGFPQALQEQLPQEEQLKSIGIAIKARRTSLGLSQRTLAKQAGLRQADISLLETGSARPGTKALLKICFVLGMQLRAFPWYFAPAIDRLLAQHMDQRSCLAHRGTMNSDGGTMNSLRPSSETL